MLTKIIAFSIRNKLLIGLFTLALIVYGSFELTKLPIDAVPDITNNQVQVITVAPSYGATDIERLVTFPIEQANRNIAGLKEIRSFSRFGLSLVTMVFNDDIDIYWARQQVTERMQKVQAQIPSNIGVPELGPVTTGLGEIYQYVLRPKEGFENKYNETDLRTFQDWIVRRQLLGVKGVAEVSSFGGKLKQFVIELDLNKLKSYDITIADVFKALENSNQNTGGAYIEKGASVLFIKSEGLIGGIEDIQRVSIKNNSQGNPLMIRDVANVTIGYATRFGAMCYNDQGEVAGAVVMMLKGANSSEVIKEVKKRIEMIQKNMPEGILIEPFLDRTKMVDHAIGTVQKNLLEGALIVVFVLVLFLGNVRAGILVASVIPLAMLFAVIMMNIFGVSGNLMSLGALDFGLIVDGAVIIVEAVMHQFTHQNKFNGIHRLSQTEVDEEVKHSANKMMNSAVFGQIIILIVYLPIFTLQGIEGKMFKPMAQTVAFALLGAFLLSLTYIPMMSTLVLSKRIKKNKNFSDRWMYKTERIFQRTLERFLQIPKTVLLLTVSLFVVAIFILFTLGGEFIPALEEGDFAVETRLLTGSSLPTTIAYTQKAAHILKTEFPEVEKVVTKIGSGEVPTDPMPMEAGDMMVILKDKKDWTSATSFPELAEKMHKKLEQIPGLTTGFQFPVQMRFNELMTGSKQDVVCKIFGENLDTLAFYAKKMANIVSTVSGAKDIYLESVTGMPQISIEYNRASLAEYGLTIAEANQVIHAAFAGQSCGLVFEGEKRFDLVVRLSSSKRTGLSDIQNVLIPTPKGSQIPLYQVANVAIKDGPNQIQREDAKRRIIVGFNIRGRDVQTIVTELQKKVENQIKFPVGYFPTYGGAFENLNEAKQRLMIAVPVSLILIFLLLYFAFNSLKQGLLIYSAIPLSAIGGILFLALRGMPFSISAGIGFIALFGVAVLNGIVLVAEFNALKKAGMSNLKEIVLAGTRTRLRPVLMTAFVASLGFFPMALSTGAGAEVQRPLATVVIGGLLIATCLTLFVLPVLYLYFEQGFSFKAKSVNGLGLIFMGLLCCYHEGKAQYLIDFKSALDTAYKNNLSVNGERLKAQYQEKLIKSASLLPQTSFSGEYGQINSSYYDTRFGVSQSMNFPTVYTRQKTILNEEWKSSLLAVEMKQTEIKKNLALVFYTVLFMDEKLKLLQHNDSLYEELLKKEAMRFDQGESNVLEKITTESQRGQIAVQVEQLKQDREMFLYQFQVLLQSQQVFVPKADNLKMYFVLPVDSFSYQDHPSIKLLLQQKTISLANTRLEKAKLLPNLTFMYNNMSMKGWGADQKDYSFSNRFQSGQISLGIPVFFQAQKARIAAGEQELRVYENNYKMGVQNLKTGYATAVNQYQKFLQTVSYYENKALKEAGLLEKTANAQFMQGEINYLEWMLLQNQAIVIKSNYLEAVKSLNESIIQLNYMRNK